MSGSPVRPVEIGTEAAPASDRRRALRALLRDPAVRGSFALMFSAAGSGTLSYVFWTLVARRYQASGVGEVSAEVSAITFLASAGSLNLINVFARFLPEAGRVARRFIAVSYAAALVSGLGVAVVFLLTPWGERLVIGGDLGRAAFVGLVVANSIFMIQDGGLLGLGRAHWIPVENVAVTASRLAILPIATATLFAPTSIMVAWALPMVGAVLVMNALLLGRWAGRHGDRAPTLPRRAELGRFIAVESVTTAVTAAVTSFLPALVTSRLGAVTGGYFYVPWVISTMISLLLSSILIAMVRESVAVPEHADRTMRRSLGLAVLVIVGAATVCLALPQLILLPLGSDFVDHGAALMRWVGLALPAAGINLLFWANCLAHRRAVPVLLLNLALTGLTVTGVLLLPSDAAIAQVGLVHCVVQWTVALVVGGPTLRRVRALRPAPAAA